MDVGPAWPEAEGGCVMSPGDGRTQQLRDAIGLRTSSADEAEARKHAELLRKQDKFAIARQIYEDRAMLVPALAPHKPASDDPKAIHQHLLDRSMARGECERRLRCSLTAQLTLSQSDDEADRRRVAAFARWHREQWRIADMPRVAPAGQEQPIEIIVRTVARNGQPGR